MNCEDRIGVRFVFAKKYMNHLELMFKNVSLELFTWYVSCSENLCSFDGECRAFLPNGIYSGREFLRTIRKFSEHYMHLVCIFGVPTELSFERDLVNNYSDYVNSNAVFALMCADGYVDFYAKDKHILDAVFDACNLHYASEDIAPRYITSFNDVRTRFWV